ncbi:LacI family DNA-binding transcriptional regulator [Cellulomonas sp. HZM]|uniref:LacI family DNA-binding transcriptional regulator n=1 Tax=Cellulomonas sp. HZM TaxID=1454010 RepID=UPI0004934053|nr:LacI family DNA-binding transcriptional regulator [Cellulomonas sp. HZM]
MPTVRDVAAQAGVSIATVSRVLNGADNVAPATRARVEQALAAGGTTAPVPRASTGARSGPVFVRCPYVLSDYFGPIVSAVAEALDLHGRTMLLDAGESAQAGHPLSTLPVRDVAGAVLVLPPEPGEELVALRRRGFPFVVVDPRVPPPRDVAAVSAAHFSGARQVTQHLLALGHRRIGLVAGPREWVAGNDRYAGHAAAMVDVGILPPPELVRHAHATTQDGHRAAGELLDLPDRPTAIVCFNDQTAVGALHAAAERGLRVPDDVSVTGFDDIEVSRATTPELTTVRQPLAEMGRIAVSLLARLVARQKVDALHVELATELVVRGSTGAVRSSPGANG